MPVTKLRQGLKEETKLNIMTLYRVTLSIMTFSKIKDNIRVPASVPLGKLVN